MLLDNALTIAITVVTLLLLAAVASIAYDIVRPYKHMVCFDSFNQRVLVTDKTVQAIKVNSESYTLHTTDRRTVIIPHSPNMVCSLSRVVPPDAK